jgi:hypothetical protein
LGGPAFRWDPLGGAPQKRQAASGRGSQGWHATNESRDPRLQLAIEGFCDQRPRRDSLFVGRRQSEDPSERDSLAVTNARYVRVRMLGPAPVWPPGGALAAGVLRSSPPAAGASWAIAEGRARGPLRRGCTRPSVLIESTRTYGRRETSADSLTSRRASAPASFLPSRPPPMFVRTRVNCVPDHADGDAPTLLYGISASPCGCLGPPAEKDHGPLLLASRLRERFTRG